MTRFSFHTELGQRTRTDGYPVELAGSLSSLSKEKQDG